jgi:predicted alpha/beta-hydrolase family hydrolase
MHHRPRPRSASAVLSALLAMLVLAASALVASPTGAGAQAGEFRKGPDPTEASVTAARGPFATATVSVPSSVAGFGGGTIHYPTDTSQGTFGAVALAPGFTASSVSYAWAGPRIASQGFVVFLIDTNSRFDQPNSRGTQLQAALDYLVNSSSVANRIDRNRLAVSGHSMGGGGTLAAANANANLQAAVALQPWHTTKSWPGIRVPTMIIGAENDSIASVASHSSPFYNSIPASSEKAFLNLNNATHGVGTTGDPTQAKFFISWLKRYVDNDTRYEQFLCPPPPAPSSTIQEYRHTCPG